MISIQLAEQKDLKEILNLQKLAYESEARLYNDWSLPALTQDIESILVEFSNSVFLKALNKNKIVGSIRAKTVSNICEIGRLIVHPEHQRLGIGTQLLEAIEKTSAKAHRYELFTGSLSEGNIRLYQRNGYVITETKPLSKTISITYMEKYVVKL